MKKLFALSCLALYLTVSTACEADNKKMDNAEEIEKEALEIRGADISFLPMLEEKGVKFYNQANEEQNALEIFKEEGMNTARLRVWKKPKEKYSSLSEVKKFAKKLKLNGMKIWLTVHYSDTWADPGHQYIPSEWEDVSFEQMKDSMYNYTALIITEIKPDIMQIGNEINNGFLWPVGKLDTNEDQCLALLKEGVRAVRDTDPMVKIMLHYAGTEGARWFFNKMNSLDFDVIGISYYPTWHGKDLDKLLFHLEQLKATYQKEVVIAETAYPFTLQWNDNTHNIAGSDENLILPDFPATKGGQKDFLFLIRDIAINSGSLGFCYWAPEWVASEKTSGTPWENQALFDFNHQALPAMDVFNK